MSINPALEAADRALSLEIKKRTTIGHLRAVARDIAGNLYGITIETGEVVVLQDRFEAVLNEFMNAMRAPGASIAYITPDALRARITAQSSAEKIEYKEMTDESE